MTTIEELQEENAALRVDVSYWNERFNFEARLKRDLFQDKATLQTQLDCADSNVAMWQKRALIAEKRLAEVKVAIEEALDKEVANRIAEAKATVEAVLKENMD
jgi:predicted RNA-binding Zn ribbon-like protein